MRPITVYRKGGSLRFNYSAYQKGTDNPEGKARQASVFVSLAEATGPRNYDTDNAKTMALPWWDVVRLLDAIESDFADFDGGRISLIHKPKGATKVLSVGRSASKDPKFKNTRGWSLKVNDDSTTVFTDLVEIKGIRRYLDRCLDLMLDE